MDSMAVFIISVFTTGFGLGLWVDRMLIPWTAHQLAGRLRSHVDRKSVV